MVGMTGVPSRLLLQPSRMAAADGQRQLANAQVESSTGRHADVSLVLGSRMGADITLRAQLTSIDQAKMLGNQASVAADMTQDVLTALNELADRFRSELTGARSAGNGTSLSASLAVASLGSLENHLSTTYDGNFLFAGLASGSLPLRGYDDGPRQAVADTFVTTFGFPADDPAASTLTSTQIENYIEGAFAALFADPAWSSTWSDAAPQTNQLRLGSGSPISLSSTADAPFARTLAKAFSLMELLGNSRVSSAAFTAASGKALVLNSEAQAEIASEQARIGIGQFRLKDAMLMLDKRKSSLSEAVTTFENIDPYEVATRINLLMTQLEASYALTGRISRMSLLSYL